MQREKLTKKQNGITLIALIITIIVMLILVGVTINVSLNGGLFSKAKEAAYKTEIEAIKEQLMSAKTIKIAENNGNIPENYGINLNDLNIEENLKNKYKDILTVGTDGELYYKSDVSQKEKDYLEASGVKPEPDVSAILGTYYVPDNSNASIIFAANGKCTISSENIPSDGRRSYC